MVVGFWEFLFFFSSLGRCFEPLASHAHRHTAGVPAAPWWCFITLSSHGRLWKLVSLLWTLETKKKE
uniref:Putative secreted protein n=1 Tax=Anopheles darlingi TaxID=43151 RepID=A0A2M4D099_ANODA